MTKKRKVKDEPIILDSLLLPKLAQTIEKVEWPYSVNTDTLHQRDKALTAFIILTGVRNSEIGGIAQRTGRRKNGKTVTLSEIPPIRKKQTRIYNNHILIVNIQPGKHGKLREEIILPKTGGLAPFTEIFEEWLKQVPDDESVIFPTANPQGNLNWNKALSRQRIHWLIKTTTGLFPHWFRGVCETIYGKQIFKNDAWALKDFMGLVNLDSTSPYVSGQWKQHEKNVYKVELK